jgi:hypothetical protein
VEIPALRKCGWSISAIARHTGFDRRRSVSTCPANRSRGRGHGTPRMATVCDPGSGRATASFAGVAKRCAVSVAFCPPRRATRKGVVETISHTAAQRWWRRLADDVTVEVAPSQWTASPGSGPPLTGLLGVHRQIRVAVPAAGHGLSGDRQPRPAQPRGKPWCPIAVTATRCHRSCRRPL